MCAGKKDPFENYILGFAYVNYSNTCSSNMIFTSTKHITFSYQRYAILRK
jgi:hypothetical protein